MPELSILIPSRNEIFLIRTIQDILVHSGPETEIIAVLDGWECDIPETDRVKVIRYAESIGQRAATNEAAKIAQGAYLMKLDAHCSMAPGFDRVMLDAFKECGDLVTMVPVMRNLHAFDWVCPNGHRRYQGPSGPCKVCNQPTRMDVVWIPKTNPQSICYIFDAEPHFQYAPRSWKKRPDMRGDLNETMSLQGSCFMVHRDRYFDLDLCEESFGSWGTQGAEVAAKSWLSGGRVLCNRRTWYAHCFRTQGGDFGFPYPQSGHQIEGAKQRFRDLFYENKWEKQTRPLSWLIQKFAPVPGWHHDDGKIKCQPDIMKLVIEQGASFSVKPLPLPNLGDNLGPVPSVVLSPLSSVADQASSGPTGHFVGQEMSVGAMSHPRTNESNGALSNHHVIAVKDEAKVEWVAARGNVAGVVQDRNIAPPTLRQRTDEPSIDKTMGMGDVTHKPNISIPKPVLGSVPDPALSQRVRIVDSNPREDPIDGFGGQRKWLGEIFAGSHDSAPTDSGLGAVRCGQHRTAPTIPSKGIVYYSDFHAPLPLLKACREQIKRCVNGHEIISVTLGRLDFGRNIVLPLQRSYLTMFRQILKGIEESKADILFLVEHDVYYHPSHFEFTPPREDTFYYDENVWHVRSDDGHALFYHHMSTSMLCAYRALLLEHYRLRVEKVEVEGFTRYFGFEPGSHKPPRGCDNYGREAYFAQFPSLDIRHHENLTANRWRKDQFRNQKQLHAWTEKKVWELPGWDRETLRKVIPNAVPTH